MDRYSFKAKRLDNGEWETGFYVKCRGHHYILPVYDDGHGYDERYAEWVEIVPETVCQYTGLQDKNVQKIKHLPYFLPNGNLFYSHILFLSGNRLNANSTAENSRVKFPIASYQP